MIGCTNEPASSSGPETFPAEPLATIQSQSGALSIEVRTGPAQPPTRGETYVELLVTDASGNPVDGLSMKPQLWMPDMGHGASVEPTFKAEGGGKYLFDRCELFMPGRWELRTSISGAANDDATARFQIP